MVALQRLLVAARWILLLCAAAEGGGGGLRRGQAGGAVFGHFELELVQEPESDEKKTTTNEARSKKILRG